MRAPTLTDGIVVLDAHTDTDVLAHLAGEDEEHAKRFGWFPRRSTEQTVRAAIRRWQDEWLTEGSTRALAIREAATGLLVGGCEVRVGEDGRAGMSYWVFPPFRGRGFATRAVQLFCPWTFAHLQVARIEVYVEPDNRASRGVARGAGFVEEGVLREYAAMNEGRRDMVLYSLLRNDLAGETVKPWGAL
jgi:RimJ/RimL family protein N-acetyltransferase